MTRKAGFVTGANAKLKISGTVVAYATDVQYREDVQHVPIYTMGKIDAHAYEPVGYSVSGSFSVIRYTKNTDAGAPAATAANRGNSPGLYPNVTPSTGNLYQQMDPNEWLASQTVDIEVFERYVNSGGTGGTADTSVIKILDCRLTRRGISLTKRGVLSESFQFVGEMIGDDNATPAPSGRTDLT